MADERDDGGGEPAQGATAKVSSTKTTKRKAAVALTSQSEMPGQKKRPRKAGKLAMIFDMPIEIWFEVFRHLSPLDLLHLSRTSKRLRETLMDRSNQLIWADALATVPGLPKCPPEMTEPQWTNLVFDHHCNGCGAPRIRTIDWVFRVRCCQHCWTAKLDEIDDYTPSIMTRVSEVIPCRRTKRQRILVCRAELSLLRAELEVVSDTEVRVAFVQERKDSFNKIKKHAALCQDWVAERDHQRALDHDRVRGARKLAILQKLKEEGWGYEIDSMNFVQSVRLTNQRAFKEAKPLTDKTWQKIKDPLIKILDDFRAGRIKREEMLQRDREEREDRQRLENKKARLAYVLGIHKGYKVASQSTPDLFPGPPDFVELPPIKSTLEAPGLPIVDERRMEYIMNNVLPSLVDKWRAGCIDRLMAHLTWSVLQESGGHDVSAHHQYTLERIKLATTVFRCRECLPSPLLSAITTEYMFYPEALGHACLTRTDGGANHDDEVYALNWEGGAPIRRQKWSPDKLILDLRAGAVAQIIVTACGMDSATATPADVDRVGARMACLDCTAAVSQDEVETWIMDWRMALRHQLTAHPNTSETPRLHVLPEHARDHLLHAESKVEYNGLGCREATVKEWCCLHCFGTRDESEPLSFVHLVMKHEHHWKEPTISLDTGVSRPILPNENYCKDVHTKPNAFLEVIYECPMTIPRSWLPLAETSSIVLGLEQLPASSAESA